MWVVSERLDNDPSGARYGCFLPDLTGLARRLPAPASQESPTSEKGILQVFAEMRDCSVREGVPYELKLERSKMKLAETVTFGGSDLNRAAELRGKEAGRPNRGDHAIVLWRGKVLIDKHDGPCLMRINVSHKALEKGRWVFLGLEANGKIFGFDISHWTPAEDQHPDPSVFYDPTEQIHPDFPNAAFCELRGQMGVLTSRDAELSATAKALFHWHISHNFCSRCGAASKMTMSGWQRNCTSCSLSHFPRTDPVVIMLITQGPNVLLGRSPKWPERMYSLLAGFIEPGETMEASVRREVFEESGIKVGSVSYLASQPWAFPNSLMFGCHGEALSTEIKLDPVELEDALWISKTDLFEAFCNKESAIKPARFGSIAQFLLKHWLADSLG